MARSKIYPRKVATELLTSWKARLYKREEGEKAIFRASTFWVRVESLPDDRVQLTVVPGKCDC